MDPASLDRLQDIVQAPPVPWWPMAPGWWILIGFGCAIMIALLGWSWHRWRMNAYRREALRQLQLATSTESVAVVLKRTALATYPRDEVASLSAERWSDWLKEVSEIPPPDSVRAQLEGECYREGSQPASADLLSYAKHWILHHRDGRYADIRE